PSKRTLFADLLGEIVASDEGPARFKRGVTQYPISGAPVVLATDADLTAIFGPVSRSNLRIGTLHHDARQPAFVLVNELLRKHFGVLGATGVRKVLCCEPALVGHSGRLPDGTDYSHRSAQRICLGVG